MRSVMNIYINLIAFNYELSLYDIINQIIWLCHISSQHLNSSEWTLSWDKIFFTSQNFPNLSFELSNLFRYSVRNFSSMFIRYFLLRYHLYTTVKTMWMFFNIKQWLICVISTKWINTLVYLPYDKWLQYPRSLFRDSILTNNEIMKIFHIVKTPFLLNTL